MPFVAKKTDSFEATVEVEGREGDFTAVFKRPDQLVLDDLLSDKDKKVSEILEEYLVSTRGYMTEDTKLPENTNLDDFVLTGVDALVAVCTDTEVAVSTLQAFFRGLRPKESSDKPKPKKRRQDLRYNATLKA